MELHKSGEDYLEAIYVLQDKYELVRSIDVAHYFDYSKPSVSRAVSLLKKEGYLYMHSNGGLELTESGLAKAKKIYERHTVLSAMFRYLGVNTATAADDACQVEHVISEETFNCIKVFISDKLDLENDLSLPFTHTTEEKK